MRHPSQQISFNEPCCEPPYRALSCLSTKQTVAAGTPLHSTRRDEPGSARPAVLGPEHGHRDLGGVGVGGNAVLIEIFRGLLDLDVSGEGSDHRLDRKS